jgi:hypothetical protein
LTAKILDFLPRDQYDEKKFAAYAEQEAEITPVEFYKLVYEAALSDCMDLIKRLKSTGRWNPVAEKLMQRVVTDVSAICASIAGVVPNGTTRQT